MKLNLFIAHFMHSVCEIVFFFSASQNKSIHWQGDSESITGYSYTSFWISLGVWQGDNFRPLQYLINFLPFWLLTYLSVRFQGNFHHWRPIFLHFETYFKTYLSYRSDLLLTDNTLEDNSPFPKQAVLQILRVMQIILENCNNKSSFNDIEVSWRRLKHHCLPY